MHRPVVKLLLPVVLAVAIPSAASADIFHYKDGRVIAGKLASTNAEDRTITVEIAPGSYVLILASELKRHETLTASEQEYAQKISSLPQTAKAHYDIAVWCSQRGMVDLEQAHYRRALDLDTNFELARKAIGYRKDSNGRWVKKEEIYGGQRGKVYYKGRWRYPESVAIEQAEEAATEAIAPLKKNLSRWHNSASFGRSPKLRNEAITKLQQVADPNAIGILSEYLLNTRKPAPPNVRLLYVNILARFRMPAAASTLITVSIQDAEQSVRYAALDALQQFGGELAVPRYIGYLGNANNEWVNRAGSALGYFNPPEATLPLIHALKTEHVQVEGGGAAMNASLQGGLTMGGGPKKKKVVFDNSGVYGTLTQLTSQSFGYDENQWLAWYASIHGAPTPDLLRDP